MTYKIYTHNYLVKNSDEVLEKAELRCKAPSDNIHSLGESNEFDDSKPVTILIPGFINLHCHLAYSKVKLESQALFSWLTELYKKTFLDPSYSPRSNVLGSIDDLLQFGTTYVVDNCFSLKESFEGISQKKIKALIGLEVFGSDPNEAQDIFDERVKTLSEFENKNPNIDLCLSPHAVYDVSKELWQKCVEWSKTNNKILLSHIAESAQEELFMQDINNIQLKTAKEFWQSINSLDAKEKNWKKYKSSVDFLSKNGFLFEKLVLAHGVYCSDEDLNNIQKNSVKLINCPRSNEFLKSSSAKTEEWKNKAIDFAMGTDSAASNYDLDLRKEILGNQFLSNKEKFNKLTIDAARILGRDQDIGSLEAGKSADFVVLEVIDQASEINKDNIFDFIMNPQKTRVKEVYINNSIVYSS
jgi:5-methylthioadenosine/S-adenosylhomocysteine deaminase